MLEEFGRQVFVNRIGLGQFKRHGKHREAVETHPGGAVRLLQKSSGRQRLRSVEHTNVIEAEEATREKIVAFGVLAIHPPGKVEQQLLEHAFEKRSVPLATRSRHLVYAPRRPRVHGRIHVTKRKLISGNLPVWMHVPFAQKQKQLVLRKMWIDFGKRDHVEGQIPGR